MSPVWYNLGVILSFWGPVPSWSDAICIIPTEILGNIIKTNRIIPIPPSHCDKERQNIIIECWSIFGKTLNTEAPVVVMPDTDSKKEFIRISLSNTGIIWG